MSAERKGDVMAKTKDSDSALVPDGMGSLGDAVGLAAGETPCQVMGRSEIIRQKITVRKTDEVILRLFLCNAPALAIVSISDEMGTKMDLANQRIPPPNPLTVTLLPSTIQVGDYTLIWTLFPPDGTEWQMVSEILVNGTAVYRHFKSTKSQFPIPRGLLFLEVR